MQMGESGELRSNRRETEGKLAREELRSPKWVATGGLTGGPTGGDLLARQDSDYALTTQTIVLCTTKE